MARDHNDEVAAAAIRALGDFGQEGGTFSDVERLAKAGKSWISAR